MPVPRHEGHHEVLPQGQFPQVRGRPVGQDVFLGDLVAGLDQGLLIDAGVLIRPRVFDQVVDVHPWLSGGHLLVVDPDHEAARIDGVDNAAPPGDHRDAGILGHGAFYAGAHQRLLSLYHRHGLALHVGAHQGPVGIVMLQKGDQRGGHRHDLPRRHIHVLHPLRRGHGGFILGAARDKFVNQPLLLIQVGIGLGDDKIGFLNR